MFWPVKPGTAPSENYYITDVSKKFKWIFFLGCITHVAQLAVDKWEDKVDDKKKEDNKYQSSQEYMMMQEKIEKDEKAIKITKMVLFVMRCFFFLWILFGRFKHTGKVCSGDYKGYDEL